MEIIVTLAYFFLVRLIFFDYKLIKFNLFWKFVVFGIYCGAALTEIIALGQYTPYTKSLSVEARVLQIAPEFGGIVKAVHAKANVPLKKGDPLFEMDPVPRQAKVDKIKAELANAKERLAVTSRLAPSGAAPQERLITERGDVEALEAQLTLAQYHLDNVIVRAPADGYVTDLILRPGVYIRLKVPVMTFIDTGDYFLIAKIMQRATQHVKEGNEVEVALEMYPGDIFTGKVETMIWAAGPQLTASGNLPTLQQIHPSEMYVLKIRLDNNNPDKPTRYGAGGIAAIYTDNCNICKVLRQLEIRSESWLNYIYNPFSG